MRSSEMRTWAQSAAVGQYLAAYEADSTDASCGYADSELAQARTWLNAHGLTIRADDRGLRVVASGVQS